MMKPQVWFCRECKSMGVLMYEEHADAYQIISLLRDQHRLAAGPSCFREPRILALENVKTTKILMGACLIGTQ